MALESPQSFSIPKDKSLAEAMEKLRQSLRLEPESHLQLEPVRAATPQPSTGASQGEDVEFPKETTASAEDVYSQVLKRGGSFVAHRIDDPSLLTRQPSLSRLRLNLEECRTLLNFMQTGPSRKGPLAGVKNSVTNLTRKALNWFITPSVTFDRAAGDALSECAASIELLSKQVQVIAHELAVLSSTANALEVSKRELIKKLPLRTDRE